MTYSEKKVMQIVTSRHSYRELSKMSSNEHNIVVEAAKTEFCNNHCLEDHCNTCELTWKDED